MISANHRSDYCRDFSRNPNGVMISDELHRQFDSPLQKYNFHQHGVIVSLHRKLKGEKTKRNMHSLQILAQNWSSEGVRTVS